MIAYRDDVEREQWVYSERELVKIARMRALRESKAAVERKRKLAERAIKEQRQAEKQLALERHRAAKADKASPAR